MSNFPNRATLSLFLLMLVACGAESIDPAEHDPANQAWDHQENEAAASPEHPECSFPGRVQPPDPQGESIPPNDIKGQVEDLNACAELNMIEVQSLMSQRATAVSAADGILQKIIQSLGAIVKNL